jgi:hypothetical protein
MLGRPFRFIGLLYLTFQEWFLDVAVYLILGLGLVIISIPLSDLLVAYYKTTLFCLCLICFILCKIIPTIWCCWKDSVGEVEKEDTPTIKSKGCYEFACDHPSPEMLGRPFTYEGITFGRVVAVKEHTVVVACNYEVLEKLQKGVAHWVFMGCVRFTRGNS